MWVKSMATLFELQGAKQNTEGAAPGVCTPGQVALPRLTQQDKVMYLREVEMMQPDL